MNLSKNKKHQYLFFFILLIYSIFNGGNSNLLIQINFILISLFFLYCLRDKNYHFSNGIDFIYEIFNFENKFNINNFSKSIKYLGKNQMINNFFIKFADNGIVT